MLTEKHIAVAHRLYECRSTCKRLFGVEWRNKIKFHTNLIHAAMKKHGIDNEIKAAQRLINEYGHQEDGMGVFTMKILAAAIEIIEPTKD